MRAAARRGGHAAAPASPLRAGSVLLARPQPPPLPSAGAIYTRCGPGEEGPPCVAFPWGGEGRVGHGVGSLPRLAWRDHHGGMG